MHRIRFGALLNCPQSVWITYIVTLTVYLVASYFPLLRLWGVSYWGYLPSSVHWFLVLGLLAVLLLITSLKSYTEKPELSTDLYQVKKLWLISGVVITVGYGVAFYYLRARTFFLGDGYQCLSVLARETPLIKYRELGESLAHIWIKDIVGGNAEQAALAAYQIVSISSGIFFVIVILVGASFLFSRLQDRLLFSLGILSGGYMLLFFGYVENYSMFVLLVAAFVIMGLLTAKGLINGWWLIVPLTLAVFFHILALTLLPAAVFLWSNNLSIGQRFHQLKAPLRIGILASILVSGILICYHFYNSSLIVRSVLLPIVENRYTVEGYTLFSLNHLIDYGNLIFILCPGIGVVAACIRFKQLRQIIQEPAYRFLAILVVATMGAMFLIDPKIGMPRDWDLFSFCGVPLVAASIFFLVDQRMHLRWLWKPTLLVILLGTVSLGVRAANFSKPFVGAQIAIDYSKLDVRRGMAWRRVIQDFYTEHFDYVTAEAEFERYFKDFPEYKLNETGLELQRSGKFDEAISYFQRSLDMNPLFVASQQNLGKCYLQTGQNRKAVESLELAARLAPDNAEVLSRLGQAYFKLDDYDHAEEAWENSIHLLPNQPEPLIGLLNLYIRTRQENLFYKYLIEVAAMDDTPCEYSLQVAEYHLKNGAIIEAVDALKHAMSKGLDSTTFKSIVAKYPALQHHF